LYAYISAESSFFKLPLALILAGAIGNVIDRIRLGYVVDFLSFDNLFGYSFPAFNVADICVVAGSIGLLIYVIFLSRKKEAFREGTFLRKLFAEENAESKDMVETSSEEEV
jgi:signal peptidase II